MVDACLPQSPRRQRVEACLNKIIKTMSGASGGNVLQRRVSTSLRPVIMEFCESFHLS
jgi:hypothetical protein